MLKCAVSSTVNDDDEIGSNIVVTYSLPTQYNILIHSLPF